MNFHTTKPEYIKRTLTQNKQIKPKKKTEGKKKKHKYSCPPSMSFIFILHLEGVWELFIYNLNDLKKKGVTYSKSV